MVSQSADGSMNLFNKQVSGSVKCWAARTLPYPMRSLQPSPSLMVPQSQPQDQHAHGREPERPGNQTESPLGVRTVDAG